MKKGILLSVASSALFATMYYYATLMQPFDGDIVFAWRILMGLPMLALVVQRARGWGAVRQTARDFSRGRFLAAMIACSLLLGVQLWLFVWAPLHGHALNVSMGYFLLPLVMVLVGRLFYRERLSAWQTWAVAFAALGVGHEWWRLGAVSWTTLLVALGYPPYFMLRRRLRVDALTSLWFDMFFLLPAAVLVLQSQGADVVRLFAQHPRLILQVPVLGLLSAVSLAMYLAASRILPLTLFGLLSYVEPMLLFWVAFLLMGEPVTPAQWLTYIPIWIAVGLVAAEGARNLRGRAVSTGGRRSD
ncbi:MAG: EamA family transporter RarD [Castellaniella sp.]|uniref:EamA family transporter RarD n=1 Tax=Castellaniella sp. TaxID=1955812 RepID=UPI002A36419F|nr:EamA family transporter RarD [Castellaniella sp.]MDY0310263.1 EamA family transporter RarD [Castellaniella sp.]